MCNARLWPQECLKGMCKRIQHIVALRFGDDGTREMWGLVGSKVWPVSNFAQQFPTTRNNFLCKRTQHSTSTNFGSCWPTMLRPFARGLYS